MLPCRKRVALRPSVTVLLCRGLVPPEIIHRQIDLRHDVLILCALEMHQLADVVIEDMLVPILLIEEILAADSADELDARRIAAHFPRASTIAWMSLAV